MYIPTAMGLYWCLINSSVTACVFVACTNNSSAEWGRGQLLCGGNPPRKSLLLCYVQGRAWYNHDAQQCETSPNVETTTAGTAAASKICVCTSALVPMGDMIQQGVSPSSLAFTPYVQIIHTSSSASSRAIHRPSNHASKKSCLASLR